MQYLVSVIYDADTVARPDEAAAIDVFNERLQEQGYWVFAGGLGEPATATVIDNRSGEPLVTDGPFVETKEVVGGYAMIEVATEQQAREIARQFMELHRVHWPAFECECEARPLDGQ